MERNIRFEWVDPTTLDGNPRNFRLHPAEQCAAFEGLWGEVGWAGVLLYNERTSRLIDGHLRKQKAIENRIDAVPVIIGSWDEKTEAKILASLDQIGGLAEIDGPAWTELLREVDTGCSELMEMFADLSVELGEMPADDELPDPPKRSIPKDRRKALDKGPDPEGDDGGDDDDEGGIPGVPESPPAEPAAGEGPGPDASVPDILWPSDNAWQIPTLDARMQAEAPVFPVTIWGSVGRMKPMHGTWALYTDDHRFSKIYDDPGAILHSVPACAVEPNYTTHAQMPRAFVLWGVYRKRFVNRTWQSKGIKTFVDLNVDSDFDDINFLGVPEGWRAFATRSHENGRYLEDTFRRAAERSGTDSLNFLVYGGGVSVRDLCGRRGWHWAPEQSDVARGKF